MPFDPAQPYATYANDVGNIYRFQGGVYYDPNGNVVNPLPPTWPPSQGILQLPPSTYANLPAASGYSGWTVFISDWGANGTLARSNGTRWLPVNGQTVLKRMGAAVSGIAQTETIVAQVLLPINAFQSGDLLGLRGSFTKSGTTDSLLLSVRMGTAGTVADTALTGFSSSTMLTGTTIAAGGIFTIRGLTTTSVQKLGSANAASAYGTSSVSAQNASTTGLTDMSANAVWVSFTIKSGGATDTVAVQELTMLHEAG